MCSPQGFRRIVHRYTEEMETNGRRDDGWIGSRVLDAVNSGLVVSLAVGILAGYSIVILTTAGGMTVPIVGPVSGQILGVLGLVTAAVASQWAGCGNCGQSADSGCSDGCGDRCSDGD